MTSTLRDRLRAVDPAAYDTTVALVSPLARRVLVLVHLDAKGRTLTWFRVDVRGYALVLSASRTAVGRAVSELVARGWLDERRSVGARPCQRPRRRQIRLAVRVTDETVAIDTHAA